jgi:hypothetical protein
MNGMYAYDGRTGGLEEQCLVLYAEHHACLLLALHTAYCAYGFRQNGSSPPIHGVINVPNIGF